MQISWDRNGHFWPDLFGRLIYQVDTLERAVGVQLPQHGGIAVIAFGLLLGVGAAPDSDYCPARGGMTVTTG